MKKLNINAGKVCILRHDEAFFGGFDRILINAGDACFSNEAYARLNAQGLSLNAGEVSIVEITGIPVDLGDAVLEGAGEYSGKFLVGGTLRVMNQQALEGVTGMMATAIIAPQGIRFGFKVTGKVHLHPPGATVLQRSITVDMGYARSAQTGAAVWTTGSVRALDMKAAAMLVEKKVNLTGSRLLISEEIESEFGRCFTADRRTVIPARCEYVDGDLTLSAINEGLYGSSLYVSGDLVVKPDALEALNRMERLVVTGEACIPHAALARWRAVGSAQTVIPYKGELWQADSAITLTHAQLEAAGAAGIAYTLMADGPVTIEADVTPGDLGCLLAVYYNSTVTLPESLIPAFNSKVIEANGELALLRAGGAEAEPPQDGVTQTLNTGSFMRI